MATFCTRCGSPLSSGPFCTKCGADARNAISPARPQPAAGEQAGAEPIQMPSAESSGAKPVTPKQGMSTLAKVGLAAAAIIFVGGAAGAIGVYYVAHQVSQKYHEASDKILGSGLNSGRSEATKAAAGSGSGSVSDVCRLLSKEDVSRAIGIEIIRAQSSENDCTFIANGSETEMLAKHASAMAASRGADQKTQQTVQAVAGGMFKMFQNEGSASEHEPPGEVSVFSFSLDHKGAEQQMRLNAQVLSNLGSQQGLPGIGDQAFVSADGMMLVRKGETLIRIMYISCPCGTEQVKPLAEEIANAL